MTDRELVARIARSAGAKAGFKQLVRELGLGGGRERRLLLEQLARLTMSHGEGATLTDIDGNRYIDFYAGVTVASLGHAHPDLVAALETQIRKVIVGSFTTENRAQLLELIASLTPGELTKTQLYSGGAEAVEAAIRLAKSYTKKFEVVGFWGGFHGKTGGVRKL